MIDFFQKKCILWLGLIFFAFPLSAQSANIEVLLQTPVAYHFFAADDGESLKANSSPTGILASVELADFGGIGKDYSLGFGVEHYCVPLTDQLNEVVYSFANIHARFPVVSGLLTSRAGLGFGSSEIAGTNKNSFQKTDAFQFFATIGFDFSEEAEVIVSLHNVFAQIKKTNSSTLLEAGGILLSLGLGMKF